MHCAESAAELPLMYSHEVSGNPKEKSEHNDKWNDFAATDKTWWILRGSQPFETTLQIAKFRESTTLRSIFFWAEICGTLLCLCHARALSCNSLPLLQTHFLKRSTWNSHPWSKFWKCEWPKETHHSENCLAVQLHNSFMTPPSKGSKSHILATVPTITSLLMFTILLMTFSSQKEHVNQTAAHNSILSQRRWHPNLCQLSTETTLQKQPLMTGRNNWVLKKACAHLSSLHQCVHCTCNCFLWISEKVVLFNLQSFNASNCSIKMLLELSLWKTAMQFVNKWNLLINSSCHGPCISQPVLLFNPVCCSSLQGGAQHKVSTLGF